MQPDLLVTRRAELTERDLPTAPLLAVEVLSPSTRRVDLTLKRSRFESAGALAYWVVEPEGPELTAWHLVEGAFEEVAKVSGSEPWRTAVPFPIELVPDELRDLRL